MGYIQRHPDEDMPPVRKIATMMLAVAMGVMLGGLLAGIVVAVKEDNVGAGSVVMAFFAAIGIVIGMAAVVVSAFNRHGASQSSDSAIQPDALTGR
jgi:cytochrome bd-type quinol oxidase subunit 2